jgi:hypothetical protein
VVIGDAIFETEIVEQLPLISSPPPIIAASYAVEDRSDDGITVRRASQRLYRQHRPIDEAAMRSIA